MQSLAALKILLIEDDYSESVLIKDMIAALPEMDWQVEWVSTFAEATAAACSGRFDICLLDYHLGEFSGTEVLRAVQAQGCRVPMILLTGQGSKEIDLEAMQAGAVDYVDKSRLRPALLERAIRYAVVQWRALEALRQSEERFRVLVETIPGGVFIYRDGWLHYTNPIMTQVTGYSAAELLDRRLDLKQMGVLAAPLDAVLTLQAPITYQTVIQTASGEPRWIELAAAPIRWENQPAVMGIFLDTTDHQLAQEAAHQQELKLTALQERQRLARDLHDAVSQTLFSANVTAETLPRLWERDPQAVREGLHALARLTKSALAEMRTLLVELRPAALEELHLRDLIQQLADSYGSRTHTQIITNVQFYAELPVEVKEVFYRATQEALNNVVKYADAAHVQIDLYAIPQGLRLSVWDDGKGFDPDHIPPKHMGLRMMQERVASIDGRLAIESAPGEGSLITVTWNQ